MPSRPHNQHLKQRGVALITVLLVFAVVAVIAAEMLRRSQLNLRSVSNLIDSRQAYYYAMGGEAMARQLLALDVKNGRPAKDSLDEAWAKVGDQQPLEIDNGAIKVEIHDLQGRFNLNSVIDADGQAVEDAVARLRQLLSGLGVDGRYADQWRDWVDRDQVVAGGGAEDAGYPDYKTAGGAEVDISALRLLHDMTAEDYARIAPHVATLPPATPININTADSSVLSAMGPIISAQAGSIRSRQRQGGYADIAALQAVLGGSADVTGLDVKSSYFEVITTVKYLDRIQRLRSVLFRDEKGVMTVLSRSRIPLFDSSYDSEDGDSQQP
jgi:general secretion pathway protein K